MNRKDINFIDDIKKSINCIEEYLNDIEHSKEKFVFDIRIKKLIIYELVIISSAVNKITDEAKNNNPQIEWRLLSDMRNFLIHQYHDVCNDIIWATVNRDIPKLKEDIYSIKL